MTDYFLYTFSGALILLNIAPTVQYRGHNSEKQPSNLAVFLAVISRALWRNLRDSVARAGLSDHSPLILELGI